ncbi:MAG: phospholipase D family protein [Bryobacterales bacterium]|nr:phospholipase D family protein [Bryobacterales bacterium]
MRYIDNGIGDPRENALFPWLRAILTTDVVGIQWQSGYFEASVLGVFLPAFRRLADENLDAIVLVGSNDGATQSSAVSQLVDALGLPRPNARLGVVSYADGFYHPKTIHLRYRSGRQVAYVGSANMTSRGIDGRNVEAGVILDTDEGDPVSLLGQVRQTAGDWFVSRPSGLFEVGSHDDVSRLEAQGILAKDPSPQPSDEGMMGLIPFPLPHRGPHHDLPAMPSRVRGIEDEVAEEPEIDGDVLIAALAGPGRWGQAAFPKWFIDNFFKVQPHTGDVLRLRPVTEAGGVGAEEEASCGHKAGSHNWYYELGLARTVGAYPPAPHKPLGVFHRIGHQTCRYTILMPGDESYPDVSACLAANRHLLNRPRKQLPRTIVPAAVLWNAWPSNWFFEV